MLKIAITEDKSLIMIATDAIKLAELIEARTGQRPKVTTVRTGDSQPDVCFGLINKEGVKQ